MEPGAMDPPEWRDRLHESAPPLAAAVLHGETALRLGLGAGWLWAGAAVLRAGEAHGVARGAIGTAEGAILALCGAVILAGRLPRLATGAGLVLLILAGGRPWALLLAAAGAAVARIALHGAESGTWLRAVAGRRRDLALHLAATELSRARAGAALGASRREEALHAAGDAYERAGRARRALEALGAPDGPGASGIGLLARGLGTALRPAPGLRGWLERRLSVRSEWRDTRLRAELRPTAAAPDTLP